ncbi:hypothetical protein [Halothiobacillus sp.]|nr:hypothetical protein [Halothiobacillus sp.]
MKEQRNKPSSFETELQAIDKRLDWIEAILREVAEDRLRNQGELTDEHSS